MAIMNQLKNIKKIKGFALLETAISTIVVSGFLISYQNQLSNKQNIHEALDYTKTSQVAVVKYFETHGVLPTTNKQAQIPEPDQISHPFVSNITIGEFGQITITMTGAKEISNKTIILEPTVKQGKISWKCTSGSLDNIYRPDMCIKKSTDNKQMDDNLFEESDVNYL